MPTDAINLARLAKASGSPEDWLLTYGVIRELGGSHTEAVEEADHAAAEVVEEFGRKASE